MKRIMLSVAFLVAMCSQLLAAPTWISFGFAVQPLAAADVVAAAEKLFGGKEPPGRVLLLQNTANGVSPTTHSIVAIYRSAAEREAYVQELVSDPLWAEFQSSLSKVATPAGEAVYITLRSWGDIQDSDVVWSNFMFDVSDPAAFVAATEQWMGSAGGQTFPGQLHLSAVQAAGLTPVSHVFSVAFASAAEREAFNDGLAGNADWATYLEQLQAAANFLGATQSVQVAAWGSASLSELTPQQ